MLFSAVHHNGFFQVLFGTHVWWYYRDKAFCVSIVDQNVQTPQRLRFVNSDLGKAGLFWPITRCLAHGIWRWHATENHALARGMISWVLRDYLTLYKKSIDIPQAQTVGLCMIIITIKLDGHAVGVSLRQSGPRVKGLAGIWPGVGRQADSLFLPDFCARAALGMPASTVQDATLQMGWSMDRMI